MPVVHEVAKQGSMVRQMTKPGPHDALTGLANRGGFEKRLDNLLARLGDEASTHALLLIDVDQFKRFNEACGRTAGDTLLRFVAALLERHVRARDIVARVGDDQFAVLLQHCPMDHAHRVAQAACDRLGEYRVEGVGRRQGVTVSVGIIEIDKRRQDVVSVMEALESACRVAKDAGGGRVHVWREPVRAALATLSDEQWVSHLEKAIDEDGFELFGQRLYRLDDISHGLFVEVLLRMPDVDGSYVSPGVFLPKAERFRLASRIDRWVLTRTLDWMASLGVAVEEIEQVAINLSGQSLGDPAAHSTILDIVRDSGVDPYKLCFEFTEQAAVTDLAAAKLFIDQARDLGVRIAVDDFGVGRFSLGYLRSVPVDTLKIDRQLLPGLVSDPLADATVRYICEVAKAIGATTVAEGVDREDVRDVLREVGIDMVQGYLIHRPEPLDDVF